MQYLLPTGIFLLMVSVGMSLRLGDVIANWRRLSVGAWASALCATFLIPPALALLLSKLFRLSPAETAGLFMVGASPGAPLLTRNIARKGFNMQLAASYQVWASVMVPVMIPIVVFAAGKLYARDIWIPPLVLFKQIALKQLLPLAGGMLIAGIAPKQSQRYQPAINIGGNLVLTALIALILVKIGPALKEISPLVPVAAILLCAGCITAVLALGAGEPLVRGTFAICNANRHVGLALLLTGDYLNARNALPIVACYALLSPFVMIAYVKYHRRREASA